MRYFALTNKALKKRNPYRHLPFIEKIQNSKINKKNLWLRRIYKKPGFPARPFTYRLPRYKRIQRFFQRNRVYIRRLYGEMRDNHLAQVTKKMVQKNDKKRKIYKNIAHYLEFNASTFLLINRFYPNVKELRQLIQNNYLLVNGKKINKFYYSMNNYDFCTINLFNRFNDEIFINKKFRFAIWRRVYKTRTIYFGYNSAFTKINGVNDSAVKIKNYTKYDFFNKFIDKKFISNINMIYYKWFSIIFFKKKINSHFDFNFFINKFDFTPSIKINWMKNIK
jgi:ribosomal protein S4